MAGSGEKVREGTEQGNESSILNCISICVVLGKAGDIGIFSALLC